MTSGFACATTKTTLISLPVTPGIVAPPLLPLHTGTHAGMYVVTPISWPFLAQRLRSVLVLTIGPPVVPPPPLSRSPPPAVCPPPT